MSVIYCDDYFYNCHCEEFAGANYEAILSPQIIKIASLAKAGVLVRRLAEQSGFRND